MNALAVLTILSMLQFCCSNFTEAKVDVVKLSQNKTHREVEPFTTILLNDEPFSIVSVKKHPIHKSKVSPNRRKENFNRVMNNDESTEASSERPSRKSAYKSLKSKPYYAIPNKPHYVRRPSVRKDVAHSAKLLPSKHQGKVIKHPKKARPPKKKIHKRHFEKSIKYYREFKRDKVVKDFGPTYRYVLTVPTKAPTSNLNYNQRKRFDDTSSLINKDEFLGNLNGNPAGNAEYLTTRDPSMNVQRSVTLAPTSSSPSKQDNVQIFTQTTGDYQNSKLYRNMPLNTNMNYEQPTIINSVTWLPTTAASMDAIHHQADIIQRNLAAASQKKKTGKDDSLEDE